MAENSNKVFTMSMGDFFEDHPQVTSWRDDALALMSLCRNLDFLVLTKHPWNVNRMIETSRSHSFSDSEMWFYANPHVWIGTSVENQEQANKRIPELLNIPARMRFLSMEPLLGEVDLREIKVPNRPLLRYDALRGYAHCGPGVFEQPELSNALHWVIVGGESGAKRRPFNPDWARSIRAQCQAAGVPFFMKQWDKVQPIPDDLMIREFPEVVTALT